ncbi:glycosyltransferase [Patescibacteria group bacterium]|nr:glycosyltransferase [Patescibacteria group bacterium]
MFSTDASVLRPGSETHKRMKEYGELFDKLRIVVYAPGASTAPVTVSDRVTAYPVGVQKRWRYFSEAYRTGSMLIKEKAVTVITCQDPFETGMVGWMLRSRFHIPLQLQVHTDIFSPFFAAESFKNRVRVMLARFLLRRADGIRVVSERIKRSLLTFDVRLSTKVAVLPIFVDVKKIQQAKIKVDLHQKYPEYGKIVLMASRLTKEKHIGLAIEAVKILNRSLDGESNMLLVIVGDGPEKEPLGSMVAAAGLGKHVVFEPWTLDMASYYRTADSFVLTSDYEGYGRTVIEAMAAGLPVIMTDVGIAGELFVDGLDGIVTPVGDAGAVAEALWVMLGDAGLREGFITQSLKITESLGGKKEYLQAYRAALEACVTSPKARMKN